MTATRPTYVAGPVATLSCRLLVAGRRPAWRAMRVTPARNRMETWHERGTVVKMTARAGMEDELGGFLAGAVELANAEVGTLVWFALRSAADTFWIVDSFPSDAERHAHLGGPIAAALMANAERLLSGPPEISAADVLASKVTS